jgi:CRISPR-associated protein Cas5d
MKAERVSYPVMTPSAARGVLEAIFWHPEMRWRVREIMVLKEIQFRSILRNEVSLKASPQREAISIQEDRTQRHTLALFDVAYLIRADVDVRPDVPADPAKYHDQFRRRAEKGQCFHRPYLGCREFAAHFGMPDGTERPIADSKDLGLMLFDILFAERDDNLKPKGPDVPLFWPARLESGVLRVPPEQYERRAAA